MIGRFLVNAQNKNEDCFLKGVSAIDVEGGPFYDPEADQALFNTLKSETGDNVEIIEMDTDINDPEFAVAAAKKLISML